MEVEAQPKRRPSTSELLPHYGELLDAVTRGDIETVTTMLDAGADVEYEAEDGATPLLRAIYKQHIDIVRLLLERGANVNTPVVESPPLFHAITESEHAPRLIQLLLDYGADIEATAGPASMTALQAAACHGAVHAVDFLIEKGLDIHRRSETGKTVLLLAAERGHTMVIKLLLAKGADLHAPSSDGCTALMLAAHWGHVETVRYLLEQGARLEDRDIDGLTALSVASQVGHADIVELLIEKGADINALSTQPRKATPAIWAAIHGHVEALKTLISHEADLSIGTDDDTSIIEATLRRGHVNTAKILLEAIGGPDYPCDSVALRIAATRCLAESRPLINGISLIFPHVGINRHPEKKGAWIAWVLDQGGELVRDKATLNLMHFALLEQDVEMLAELLSLGVDPNLLVFDGDTPLHAAVGCHNREIVQLLVDSGADPARPSKNHRRHLLTPLHYAVVRAREHAERDTSIVDALLATGRCRLMHGEYADLTVFAYILDRFTRWKDGMAEKLAVRMLESTPDINDDRSNDGWTLMHTAVLHKKTEIIELLRQKGADINIKDKDGLTPFSIAFPTTPEFLDFLITQGADPSAVDINGASALHHAAGFGQVDALRYLLDLDSTSNDRLSVDTTDLLGYTPLQVAIIKKHEEAALYLLERGASISHQTHSNNRTALHYAALRSLHRVVDRILVDPTAVNTVNTTDRKGWTPLALACIAPAPTVIPSLISHGASINTPNPLTGTTAPHISLQRPQTFTRSDAHDDDDAALILLRHPTTDLTLRDPQHRTLLHLAATHHNLPAAQFLLSHGLSPNTTDITGKTPLSTCSNPHIALALLQHGADVHHAEPNGWTPVQHAVHRCWVKTYAVLVQHGAHLDARTRDDGMSARERMERMGGMEVWETREGEFICEDVELETRRERAMMREVL